MFCSAHGILVRLLYNLPALLPAISVSLALHRIAFHFISFLVLYCIVLSHYCLLCSFLIFRLLTTSKINPNLNVFHLLITN